MRGNVIIIDGIRFTQKKIDSLPYDLSMEAAKIIPVDDGIAVQSEYAYLSNMYKTVIKYDGEDYPSSEHLYSAEFVRHHERMDLLGEIITAEEGFSAKRLIKNIKIKET